MKEYRFKVSSYTVFAVSGIFIFGTWLCVTLLFLDKSRVYIPLFFAIIILTYLVARSLSSAKTTWTISQTEIHIHYEEKLFFKERVDQSINWDDIIAYQVRDGKHFHLLKLRLKSGKTLRFWHNTFFLKGDFHEFTHAFVQRVEAHNKTEVERLKVNKKDYKILPYSIFKKKIL